MWTFPQLKISGQNNRFLTQTREKDAFEGMDYSAFVMVFPFMAAFRDRAKRYPHDLKCSEVHKMYLNLVNYLMITLCGVVGSKMDTQT